MSKQNSAAGAPATAIDARTGTEYRVCGAKLADGHCMRFANHSEKRGGHRSTLERPISPEDQAKRDAWKALGPDGQQAELERRKAVTASKRVERAKERTTAEKRAAKVVGVSKRSAPPHARQMGSGPVASKAAAPAQA